MTWGDFGKVLLKAAPTIATAATAGNPLAGYAVTAIENALGVTPKSGATLDDRKEAVAAAAGADPGQIAAIMKADNDFKLAMATIGFKNKADIEALNNADRADARR